MKPGTHLYGVAGDCEVIVVRAPSREIAVTCGGHPMLGERPSIDADQADGAAVVTRVGKRYRDSASGLEVLCVKSGSGALAADGVPLELAAAKPLPASD